MASFEIFSMFGKIGADNDEALKKIDETVKKAKEADDKIPKTFGQGLTNFLTKASQTVGSFASQIGSQVDSLGSQVLSIGSSFNKLAGTASSALSSIGSGISAMGGKITNGITKPLLAAGTAFAGLAIAKGWGRVTAIDSATVKLQALGNSIEDVALIADNANESVTGTAHGLDEAFTVAAQASASGVQAGKEMETYLRRVADAAAFAEVGMDDMGSIFNKVLTGGVAQAQELNQMADRGIPIFQMLAESMGVSADEVKGLASEGLITADVLFKAFDGIEGYAKKGAATFAGAWSLAMSSVSRIGANIFGQFDAEAGEVTGLLSLMKDGALALRDALIPLEALSSRLGDSLTEMLSGPLKNFEKFAKNWKEMDQELQISALKQVGNFVLMAGAAGPFLLTIGKIASTAGAMGKNVTKVGKSIGKFTTTITKAGGPISKFSSRLAKVGKEGSLLNGVMSGLGGSLSGVTKMIAGFLTILTGVGSLGLVMAGIGAIVAAFGLIPEGMREQINNTIDIVTTEGVKIIDNLIKTIRSRLPEMMKTGSELLTNILNGMADMIPSISRLISVLLEELNAGLQANGAQIFDAGMQIVLRLISGVTANFGKILELGITFIQHLADAIVSNADEIIDVAIELIDTLVMGLIDALPALINAAGRIVDALGKAIIDNKDRFKKLGGDILESIGQAFKDNPGAMTALAVFFFGRFSKSLIGLFKSFKIGGLLKGLFSAEGGLSISAFATNLFGGLGTVLKGLLAPALTLVKGAITGLIGVFTTLSAPVLAITAVLAAVAAALVHLWQTNDTFRENVTNAWTSVVESVTNAFNSIVEAGANFWAWLQELFALMQAGNWGAVWEMLKQTAINAFITVVTFVSGKMAELQAFISSGMQAVSSAWSQTWESIKSKASEIWNAITSTISEKMQAIVSNVTEKINDLKNKWTETWNSFKESVSSAFEDVKSAVSSGLDSAVSIVTGFVDRFKQAGANIVSGIADGIRGGINKVTGAVGDVLQRARNLLPFSPPKDKSSPMYGIEKNGIVEMIAKGVLNSESKLTDAMKRVLDQDLSMADVSLNPALAGAGAYGSFASSHINGGYPAIINLLTEMKSTLKESNELNEYLMSEQNRIISQAGKTYLDGREVSKVLKPHLDYESKVMESRNKRLRGER